MNTQQSKITNGDKAQINPDTTEIIRPSLRNGTFIGIDNGFSGAVAAILSNGTALFEPVHVVDLGKERLLDLEANRALLRRFVIQAGGNPANLLAVCEQCQPNPKFGAHNNFTNGKNGEFWRILLSLEQIPFRVVNPQQWQKALFRGVRGTDTKVMADLVRRQRFPGLSLEGFNRKQREGITDALCIALCARDAACFELELSSSTPMPSRST